jgi:hypothetical protein
MERKSVLRASVLRLRRENREKERESSAERRSFLCLKQTTAQKDSRLSHFVQSRLHWAVHRKIKLCCFIQTRLHWPVHRKIKLFYFRQSCSTVALQSKNAAFQKVSLLSCYIQSRLQWTVHRKIKFCCFIQTRLHWTV